MNAQLLMNVLLMVQSGSGSVAFSEPVILCRMGGKLVLIVVFLAERRAE